MKKSSLTKIYCGRLFHDINLENNDAIVISWFSTYMQISSHKFLWHVWKICISTPQQIKLYETSWQYPLISYIYEKQDLTLTKWIMKIILQYFWLPWMGTIQLWNICMITVWVIMQPSLIQNQTFCILIIWGFNKKVHLHNIFTFDWYILWPKMMFGNFEVTLSFKFELLNYIIEKFRVVFWQNYTNQVSFLGPLIIEML